MDVARSSPFEQLPPVIGSKHPTTYCTDQSLIHLLQQSLETTETSVLYTYSVTCALVWCKCRLLTYLPVYLVYNYDASSSHHTDLIHIFILLLSLL